MVNTEWTRDRFERSVSHRCVKTKGKDIWPSYASDFEMAAIVAAEEGVSPVPAWAEEIVEHAITWPPLWCPHYLFPEPFLDVVTAIGKQQATFVHGCYTVRRERKERLVDYVFCLDAWLSGASAREAAAELAFRKRSGPDWDRVCTNLWGILGDQNQLKELLIRRMVHRQRWWLKTTTWDDDRRDRYCCDQYLGNIAGAGDSYGNPGFCDPYFGELKVPSVKATKAQLVESYPEWQRTWDAIENSQLCAPKAFRFLERLIWFTGQCVPYSKERKGIPSFLQCEDTYPDSTAFGDCAQRLLVALREAAVMNPPSNKLGEDVRRRAGEITAVKSWLLRLFARKLEVHALAFRRPAPSQMSGQAGTLSIDHEADGQHPPAN